MARPKMAEEMRRTERFGNPRYTPEEKQRAEQNRQASGLDASDYVRSRVLDHRIPPARSVADARLLTELNILGQQLRAIGNNVNQLARDRNAGRSEKVAWTAVYDRLQAEMTDVGVMLRKISERL